MDQVALSIYWLLVIVVAAPSSLFNGVAAVVMVARAANQLMWMLWPAIEPVAQGVVFTLAAILALWCWRTTWCIASAIFFIPMAVASFSWAGGGLEPVVAWWVIVGCGIAQLVILPFGNDWHSIREGVDSVRDLSWLNRLLRVPAWMS